MNWAATSGIVSPQQLVDATAVEVILGGEGTDDSQEDADIVILPEFFFIAPSAQ
jgi:hypothetical protein